MADKKANDAPTFELALGRLEALVKEMESGKLSLEEMMARFEEGTGLVGLCSAKLNEVEKKIEVLVRKGEGVTTEPLDEKSLREEG